MSSAPTKPVLIDSTVKDSNVYMARAKEAKHQADALVNSLTYTCSLSVIIICDKNYEYCSLMHTLVTSKTQSRDYYLL